MDKLLSLGLEVGRDMVAGVGDELALSIGIDEETAGGETAPYHVLGKISGDPGRGGTSDDVDPRIFDLVIAAGLGSFLEGAGLAVP